MILIGGPTYKFHINGATQHNYVNSRVWKWSIQYISLSATMLVITQQYEGKNS